MIWIVVGGEQGYWPGIKASSCGNIAIGTWSLRWISVGWAHRSIQIWSLERFRIEGVRVRVESG